MTLIPRTPDPAEPARVLVVEDDSRTAELVALYLRHAGHRVWTTGDGRDAAARLAAEPWDLVLLDRMLPGHDGLHLCRLAAHDHETPVIFVSALTLEEDRLAGFDAGGDDYLTKPFSPRELVARVAALLRRRPPRSGAVVACGTLRLEPGERRARLGEMPLELTPSEFAILLALAGPPARTRSRDALLEHLPASGGDALPRTIDVHVRNLRRKLGDAGGGIAIETVQGLGYRLVAS